MQLIQRLAKDLYRKLIYGNGKLSPFTLTNDQAINLIKSGIEGNTPFLCARMGCTELQTIIFARRAQDIPLKWMLFPFWNGVLHSIHNSSGFFSPTKEGIYKFADLYESQMNKIDVLASWHPSERFFEKFLNNVPKISIAQFGPDLENDSWLLALKGKRVLVINPFAETIKKQYLKREYLFDNPNILPEFKELITIKSVQSIGGIVPKEYNSWFEALEDMENQISKVNFDIALISCGAYGFPLACWIKQNGGKAIILGDD